MANKNTLLVWLVVLACVLSVVNVGYGITVNSKLKAERDAGITQAQLDAAIAKIKFPAFPEPKEYLGVDVSGIESRLDSLESEVVNLGDEDASEEAEAERLVLLDLDSRDFKKALTEALNVYYNGSFEVESYRHITEVVVKDLDVDYADEEAEVTVEIKVYYYVDGDEDEDEKARLDEFVVLVTDLDEGDEYLDAEVDDSYLDALVVNKVY